MKAIEDLKAHIKKMSHLGHAEALMAWDMETYMPKKGAEAHIEAMTYLSGENFKLSVSDEMQGYLDAATAPEVYKTLSAIDRKMVDEYVDYMAENKNVPVELQQRRTEVTSRSQHAWGTAKHANDFDTMAPYFEEIIAISKEIAGYMKPGADPYDVWLDKYEKGLTKAKVSEVFKTLKDETVPLIEAVCEKAAFDDQKFIGTFKKADQIAFSNYLMEVIGYDLEAGNLAESEHPFTIGDAPFDVRITTNFDERDIRSSAFSVLHEGGHAIYEQNINPALVGTGLNTGTSMGIHESQSRFYENIIGRNKNFWLPHYEKLQGFFPSYKAVSLDEFYRGMNKVERSLIRVDADELTYNLHVIIRFELEVALFDGILAVKDLPAAWHDKMKAYLGVAPTCHSEGVLQDIHWPGGMFGYFPSYALGNIYGGQFLDTMTKELGEMDPLLHDGKLSEITAWLGRNIHQHGAMKRPMEIIQDTCGTSIDARPIIRYYTDKYTSIYGL